MGIESMHIMSPLGCQSKITDVVDIKRIRHSVVDAKGG